MKNTEKDEIKVERGVSIPKDSRGRPKVYPWGKMKVGDSVLIKANGDEGRMSSARTAAYFYGIRHQAKFISRSVPGGLRIWRTE